MRPLSPRRYNPNISEELEVVVLTCLEKDPKKRFGSVQELLMALRSALGLAELKDPLPEPPPPVNENKTPKNNQQTETEMAGNGVKRHRPVWPFFAGAGVIAAIILIFLWSPRMALPPVETPVPTETPALISTLEPTEIPVVIIPSVSPFQTYIPLTVTSTINLKPLPTTITTPTANDNGEGNNQNWGMAAIQGDWIYYSNNTEEGHLYRINTLGSQKQKLNNYNSKYINVREDWIYFVKNESGNIYRMRKDGSEEEKINSDSCGNVFINDEWIYYKNYSDNETIYRIGFDGNKREQLTTFSVGSFALAEDWIFYGNSEDHNSIYRMNVNGDNKEKFSPDSGWIITFLNNWIYYETISSTAWYYEKPKDRVIRRVKMDGSKNEITNCYFWTMNSLGDQFFYASTTKLMKTDASCNNRETIANVECNEINIVDNWIYCSSNSGKDIRMHLDGSGQEPVS